MLVEVWPLLQTFGWLAFPQAKGVACGAEGDQGFTICQIFAQHIELSLGKRSTTNGPDGEVGLIEHFDSRKVVAIIRIGVDAGDFEERAEMFQRENW